MRKIGILSFICLFLIPQLTLAADIIYVGPARTYTTIQAGIDAAADGDTVIVDPGTYTGEGNRDIEITGKSITVRSDTGPENCIIDCQATEIEPHRGFNFSNNQAVNSIIDSFTITNGLVLDDGAGIDCRNNQNSALIISNCSISNNSAFGRGGTGGGISAIDGIYSIYNCTISDNSANYDGGAIYSENSNTDIKNCTIKNNSSSRGGGFYCSNSSATVQNCTFTDNSSSTGSAMYNYSSDPILTNCILWGDSASQIHNNESTPVISYCCIKDWSGGGTGNFPDDPLLAPDGYHLQPASPCINAGDPSADYTGQTDIDGQPRVMAGWVDIGADEVFYQSVTLRVPADYSTIQAAIDAASGGDMVLIADDTYIGDGNRDLDFHGKAITVKSENGPENCIIDSQGTYEDRHRGFYFHNGEYQNSVLDGLTIINGYPPNPGSGNPFGGGGIACYNAASPTIKNCYFSGNYAHAISCDGASPKIDNCIITENTSSFGGGIGCHNDALPLITKCTITGNSADYDGGGIFCLDSSPVFIDCNISDNSAGGGGGAVYCMHNSYPTIINSTITGNSAGFGGGGLAGSGDPLNSNFIPVVTNCIISNNTAQNGFGGGLLTWYGPIKNCIISGNTSYNGGGGLAACDGPITNCTITGNSSQFEGGGTYNYRSKPTLTNCILWGNSPSQIYNYLSTPVINYCCIQDWPGGGTGNLGDDPSLDPDGFHLQYGSPCINAGDPSGDYTDQTDIDGQPRVIDERVDIGADESSYQPATLIDLEITGPNQIIRNYPEQ